MKRRLMTALAVVGVGGMLVGCTAGGGGPVDVDLGSGPAAAGEVKKDALAGVTLTFSSWGGIFQDAQIKSLKPFEEASGAKVLSDGPTEYSKVKAQVDSKNVSWDVVDTDIIWADKNCGEDGLLMDLDTKIVDTSKIPNQELVGKCYVPAMQYGYVIMYNEEAYPTAPTGWADFFDTKKFPGKRAIAGFEDIGPGVYEGALLADGVAPDKLYPLDMDRAYKKLDGIRDNLIYWKTGAESQQMVESGEADMVLLWSGRGYGAVENGAKYKPIWNQSLIIADALAVPKGAKNPDASMALINYYLGTKSQEIMAVDSSYSPVNVDAKPKLSKLAEEYLTTKPEIADQMVKTNQAWWAENYDAELERWMTWMQG
ncbi:ABC transporter substrate-binding protein [Leucobacter sp. CSA2]|uniref:ABC transporter substrate-binding protein n=2 Tax=Leucobacter edaphi TaxID=2796472 RepID=A0A934QD57_9MICO|nr:ABC transporter substrate-binding protein [Leucobacter edaphi]